MTRRVELFCEDSAHESCARALVERIAREVQVSASLHTATASSGVGRLKRELKAFQALASRRSGTPDLLVVLVDANAVGPAARRAEIEDILDTTVFPHHVVGTPDPCVERWLLADPTSFAEKFGVQPDITKTSDRDAWKTRLVETLEDAGQIVVQGGAELSEEIIDQMDFYQAGSHDPTIRAFTNDLRASLRRLAEEG
ncbi:MAG TPA: hypothetical protein VMG80_06160 [Solirubrobacteraceae bacterium]|nr:hypothetical protein [Solirubrobacteraceae bacterium]